MRSEAYQRSIKWHAYNGTEDERVKRSGKPVTEACADTSEVIRCAMEAKTVLGSVRGGRDCVGLPRLQGSR